MSEAGGGTRQGTVVGRHGGHEDRQQELHGQQTLGPWTLGLWRWEWLYCLVESLQPESSRQGLAQACALPHCALPHHPHFWRLYLASLVPEGKGYHPSVVMVCMDVAFPPWTSETRQESQGSAQEGGWE